MQQENDNTRPHQPLMAQQGVDVEEEGNGYVLVDDVVKLAEKWRDEQKRLADTMDAAKLDKLQFTNGYYVAQEIAFGVLSLPSQALSQQQTAPDAWRDELWFLWNHERDDGRFLVAWFKNKPTIDELGAAIIRGGFGNDTVEKYGAEILAGEKCHVSKFDMLWLDRTTSGNPDPDEALPPAPATEGK